ncbi:ankyrin repeat and SAM domain-containing protein 1A [Polyergus mexicanus]|uniref:ankyrin repeat and SAM domain-containing protein 1A n=1 Tax=Polyergus mexicanus TaxID=615972 RepID=UPI0038B4DAF0
MGKDQELLEAARSGNVTVVEKILGQRAKRSGPLASLRRGPGANVQDASGYSALHHAALNGHRDVVRLLLQYEASTNVVDAKGSSPLHLAAWAGDAEIVRLILSQGPSVPKVNLATKDNETALHCAAQYGHTEVVAQLLQYGCDPSIRNSRGESALDLAAQYGRLETVELLVRTHPELIESLRNSSSSLIFPHTPLHLASRNGHRAVVEVLLAAGVDVNTRTSAGTAMHEAALCGKMEVVRALLDRGVDLGIRDSRQNTVLDLLGQFPPHVTQDITAVIKRHRSSSGVESDADSENLPPIPVQGGDSLGSPYENVRPGDDLSPAEGTSPTQWQFYHKPRDDDRRVSGTSFSIRVVYKRRSRDMETETDEDLLQFPTAGSLDASSGSLSSVSLSDKSMSTDNVEEYFGDMPFAGLLKGSVTAERPRTLRRLRNVYGQTACGMGTGSDCGGGDRLEDGEVAFRLSGDRDRDRDEKSLSIMSPFDEQEEWAKISEIMASFGTGLVRESVFVSELEKEFQTRLGLNSDISSSPIVSTSVGQWLSSLNLADYESLFINYGFDDLEFINGVLDESDLRDMGINSDEERAMIVDSVGLLNKRVEKRSGSHGQSVEEWLKSIHLENYAETFRKHLYTDMDRVKRIWEVELAAVLEIQKPAHRKRILASVNGPNSARAETRNGTGTNLEDLNKDLNTLKTNIQQLKEEIREKLPEATVDGNGGTSITGGTNSAATGTLRHRKNRPAPQPPQRPSSHNGAISAPEQLEIRAPSELLFGVPSTLKTQWRHQPKALVTGCVTYVANYLGSTVVKELRGTESTKKSIQKLKKTFREPRATLDIMLAISYRGVRFLNTLTNEPICEHEIRNIHCACQDADDLTHFAYITKDHASSTHFCHVFCVPTMDQATEVILTLGQAFEVAYQMALKDKIGGHAIRSQSANQLTTLAGSSKSTSKMSVSPDSASDPISRDTDHTAALNSTACANSKLKSRSKSIPNPNLHTVNPNPTQDSNSNSSSSSTTTANCNPSSNSTSSPSANSITSSNSNSTTNQTTKPLVTHGRSHSVNDIKVNGNQLKLASAPVDDIGIGVKDMKPGSRAPIALSEEL